MINVVCKKKICSESNCSRATLIERRSQSSLPNWERNGSFTLFRNQERRGSDTQFFRERSNERHSFLRGSPMQIKKPPSVFFKLRQILCNAPNCLINPCAALIIFLKRKLDTYIHRHYEAAIMVDRWIGWSWSRWLRWLTIVAWLKLRQMVDIFVQPVTTYLTTMIVG